MSNGFPTFTSVTDDSPEDTKVRHSVSSGLGSGLGFLESSGSYASQADKPISTIKERKRPITFFISSVIISIAIAIIAALFFVILFYRFLLTFEISPTNLIVFREKLLNNLFSFNHFAIGPTSPLGQSRKAAGEIQKVVLFRKCAVRGFRSGYGTTAGP